MARIAVGGFGHETNSFITHRADFAYFAEHRDRPPFVAGEALLARFAEGSLPLCGFLKEVETRHSLVPLVWAHGSAGGTVTDDAFERIVGEMVAMLSKAPPVDAVYLDLHGAMTTDYFQDAEGEILRRVRAAAGDVPIVASLDYHANVTPEMVALADSLVAFRSYPHIDRPETGRRACRVLEALLKNGRPAGRAFRSLPFMIPLTSQCTLVEPSRTVVAASRDLEGAIVSLAYAAGFPQSDLYWCGPSVFCHAETQAAADENADNLAALVVAREPEFVSTLFTPREGVARALDLMTSASRTVVIADVQDNPGAGGSGDTTGILRELLRANAAGAVLGIFCDPDAARAAHDAGEGATITLLLGGK
jgi:microcystin degradation protein MlrC